MEHTKEKHKCAETVYRTHGPWAGSRCGISAKYHENDKWWCKRHAPSERKKKYDESLRLGRIRADDRKKVRDEHDELHRRGECFPTMLEALEAFVEVAQLDVASQPHVIISVSRALFEQAAAAIEAARS